MEINPEKSFRRFDNRYLENNGFINSHLCVNAETEIEHTKHDSSYTVIAVPSQNMITSNKINYNCATFQFFFNISQILVVNMKPGTIFTYSGYMMTHQQQFKKKLNRKESFVNIVSYNSKRLFSNMMESFRHDIGVRSMGDQSGYFILGIHL